MNDSIDELLEDIIHGPCATATLKRYDQHIRVRATDLLKKKRKPGGGRKPKHGEAMVQLQARVPPAIRAQLIAEFDSVQKAVDALIIAPRLSALEIRQDGEVVTTQ